MNQTARSKFDVIADTQAKLVYFEKRTAGSARLRALRHHD